jgi:hypothetical protein
VKAGGEPAGVVLEIAEHCFALLLEFVIESLLFGAEFRREAGVGAGGEVYDGLAVQRHALHAPQQHPLHCNCRSHSSPQTELGKML